jgi:hypothetical protein
VGLKTAVLCREHVIGHGIKLILNANLGSTLVEIQVFADLLDERLVNPIPALASKRGGIDLP